jgi:carboxypeptidase Q
MKKFILLVFINCSLFIGNCSFAQQSDSIIIKHIYDEALKSKISYKNLEYLCKKIGGRLTGSPQAAAAVAYTYQVMNNMGLDSVWLQDVTVPVWVRGPKEHANITSSILGSKELSICAIGSSIGTGYDGIYAKVIEVKSDKELDSLAHIKVQGSKSNVQNLIEGRIVFFNRAADQTEMSTFSAYGGSVGHRYGGASQAAKFGAIGVIVRSATVGDENNPHTGNMHYNENYNKIPAVCVSTAHADLLDDWISTDPNLILFIKTECKTLKDTKSFNVIGQIKGSEHHDEYITVGGHLDSWDLGEGAQDDGTGAIQSIEVLRLYKALNLKPSHTIRAVMFIDEEIAQSGGRAYFANALKFKEKHIAAIESDRGGFTPQGFSIDATKEVSDKIISWSKLFLPYGLFNFSEKGGGTDIDFLKKLNVPLLGLVPDSQRYFECHHSSNDVFETVNRRELQLGSASMASFIYLIDKYGL